MLEIGTFVAAIFNLNHPAQTVQAVMGMLTLAFILLPFIPGDLPRRIPIYKLIWRDHYRELGPGRHSSTS